ncbi:helix-turn-helix domain-containing protein [Deinococcus sp. PEB2-67]
MSTGQTPARPLRTALVHGLRRLSGPGINELVIKTGISKATLYALRKGNANISLDKAETLASALRCPGYPQE